MTTENRSNFAKFEGYIKNMPRAELGGLIKEYIAESNHGGWDGFESRDLTGIARLLGDMMIYHHNAIMGVDNLAPDEAKAARFEYFTRLSNVSPVE